MRKFIIEQDHDKRYYHIQEVEVELVTALEDPSVGWLPQGEYRARVLKPGQFKEKSGAPAVWYSFVFFDDLKSAQEKCNAAIRENFEFELRKYGTSYTEEQVQATLAAVQVVAL